MNCCGLGDQRFRRIQSRMTIPTSSAPRDDAQPVTSAELLPLVYDELRRVASAKLRDERVGDTLQATALVHEAFLRLTAGRPDFRWISRSQFFAAAAEAMRRILVERARSRNSQKHGGQLQRVPLQDNAAVTIDPAVDLMALDEALTELERHDSLAAEFVKLRFFAGFGHLETADLMGIERRAADRLWLLSRTWLYQRLQVHDARGPTPSR